ITLLSEKERIRAPQGRGQRGIFSAARTIVHNLRARRDRANLRSLIEGSSPIIFSKLSSSSIRLETPGPVPASNTHSLRWDRRNATALRLKGPASPTDIHSLVDS